MGGKNLENLEKPLTNGKFFGKMAGNFEKMNPKKYLSEAIHELRNVKWPTKKHAVRISVITGIFVIVSTIVVAAVDFALEKVMFSATKISAPATPKFDVKNVSAKTQKISVSGDKNAAPAENSKNVSPEK